MNKAGTSHLPVLGVGPIYVSGIFALTVTASVLSYLGFASNGAIANAWIRLLMIAAGLLGIAEAVIVWCAAVFGSHMIQSVKTGKLITFCTHFWIQKCECKQNPSGSEFY